MTSEDHQSLQLNLIETRWSLIRRAHGESLASGVEARQVMVMRYSPAVRSYLGGILRNDQEADELAQEFMVKMLQGDFSGADAERGRFRDLVKTSLRNLVRNHWRKQKVRQTVDWDLEQETDGPSETDQQWLCSWQTQVLGLAWQALEDYERSHKGSVAFSVLKLRTDYPDDDSPRLAERLSAQIGKTVNAATARQQLRRARLRFAGFLVREIADTLQEPTEENLEAELVALGLFEYVREFLPIEIVPVMRGENSRLEQ